MPCDILVDGRLLLIGRNLYEALLRMRVSNKPRRLWIDAICINQSDNEEKTFQVEVIWQIYGDATAVLVWLGEDSVPDDGRKSFAFCTWAVSQQPRWESIRDDCRQRFATILECFNIEASAPLSAIRLEHVEIFFSRAWFTRLWIIQEFSLASDAVMHCGRYSIDIQSIMWLIKYSHAFGPKFLVRYAVDDGDGSYLGHSDGKGLRFNWNGDAATRIYGHQCKDPRDRVAALISISNTNRNNFHSFSINYATAVEPNYTHFAEYLLGCVISNYSQVEILWQAAVRHPYGRSGDLLKSD